MSLIIKIILAGCLSTRALLAGEQGFTRPLGLYVCRGPSPAPDKEVAFPFIAGWLVRPGWDEVEPSEGKPDWRLIDGDIRSAQRLHKKITLAVLCGPHCPAWLYADGAQRMNFKKPPQAIFNPGQPLASPPIWDEVFLEKWTSFIAELGQRYGQNPAVGLVHITGATENGLEMQLPHQAPDQEIWKELGYTPQKAIRAWEKIIDAFAAAFPGTALDLDIHPVLGSNEVAEAVSSYGHQKLGGRFGLYGGWLSGKNAAQDHYHAGVQALAQAYGKKTFLDFQMISNQSRHPERFAEGGLPSAFDQGFVWGARYFEVWEPDAMNPDLHPMLEKMDAKIRESAKKKAPAA